MAESDGNTSGDFLAFTKCIASGGQLVARRLSIIGTYAKTSHAAGFVQHASLLKSGGEIDGASEVEVFHSGPPITTPGGTSARCKANIVADLHLDLEELEGIDNWLAGVEKEVRSNPLKPFEQYHIVPHMVWVYSEMNRRLRRRFSCSGFVIEAYKSASIDLIDTETLPLADEEVLSSVYSELIRFEKMPPAVKDKLGFKSRADLGIDGSGSWPIALPGYLFHASSRVSPENSRPKPFVVSHMDLGCYPLVAE